MDRKFEDMRTLDEVIKAYEYCLNPVDDERSQKKQYANDQLSHAYGRVAEGVASLQEGEEIMYPKFIEVHSMDNAAFSVNVNEIVLFKNGRLWVTSDRGEECVPVAETYDELKALIKDCGCLIHKADPRLDTEHPLTMDDLMTMVGEPVWNSNLNVWLLVKGCSDMYVDLLWTSGNVSTWDKEELESFPLYRIRQ